MGLMIKKFDFILFQDVCLKFGLYINMEKNMMKKVIYIIVYIVIIGLKKINVC